MGLPTLTFSAIGRLCSIGLNARPARTAAWTAITERVKEYYIFLLILQTGMIGAFVSLDFLLFFLFWEVMLVPMYFLIGVWGGTRRIYAAQIGRAHV